MQEIRYRRHGLPPPCGHGYDLDERDDKCYPNGTVPPRFQSAGIILWSTAAAGGRCHAVTAPIAIFAMGSATTGTVPRQYQDGRAGYHTRRNGYYEMR